MSDERGWSEIVRMQVTFPHSLVDRIDHEAQRRGISFQAEVRRMLTFAYDFEDAVNAQGRRAHPTSRGRLTADPPDPTLDEHGAPL